MAFFRIILRVSVILAVLGLTSCSSSNEDISSGDGKFEHFQEDIKKALLGDQADLGSKDFAEIQARAQATHNGVLDEDEYERLLEIKRATVPNMRVEFAIVDAGYYQSGGSWHANVIAEKRIIIDGSRLSPEGWKNIRQTYNRGSEGSGTYIDDEEQQVIMSNLENATAIYRDGTWVLNPTRIVE